MFCDYLGMSVTSGDHNSCASAKTCLSKTQKRIESSRATCKECGESFSTRHNMTQHVRRMHKKDARMYICRADGCGFSSKRADNVKRHMKTKHSEYRDSANNGKIVTPLVKKLGSPDKESKREMIECGICKHTFVAGTGALEHHTKLEHSSSSFSSPTKNGGGRSKVAKSIGDFSCPVGGCGFSSRWKNSTIRHMESKHKIKSTDKQGMEVRKMWRKQHTKRTRTQAQISNPTNKIHCDYCPPDAKTYDLIESLAVHVRQFHRISTSSVHFQEKKRKLCEVRSNKKSAQKRKKRKLPSSRTPNADDVPISAAPVPVSDVSGNGTSTCPHSDDEASVFGDADFGDVDGKLFTAIG